MFKCVRCKESKPATEYYVNKSKASGREGTCKECRREQGKKAFRMHRYGISIEEFKEMVQTRKGRCDICCMQFDNALCVDHDHKVKNKGKRGSMRGLLCNRCNLAIGYLNDSIENICRAAVYLMAYKRKK